MKYTLGDLCDGIEKNGYPQIKHSFFSKDGACALGQAFLNLGIASEYSEAIFALSKIDDTCYKKEIAYEGHIPSTIIVRLNDVGDGLPLPEIAARIRSDYKDYLNEVIYDDGGSWK